MQQGNESTKLQLLRRRRQELLKQKEFAGKYGDDKERAASKQANADVTHSTDVDISDEENPIRKVLRDAMDNIQKERAARRKK